MSFISKTLAIIFLIGIATIHYACNQERTVKIEGKLYFQPEEDYFFLQEGQDQDSTLRKIDVNPDRSFSFTIANPKDVVYSILFTIYGEGYGVIKFMPDLDQDNIHFDLHGIYGFRNNHVRGSKTTESIWKADSVESKLYSDRVAELFATNPAKAKVLYAEKIEWNLKKFEQDFSIPNYHELIDIIRTLQDDAPVSPKRVNDVLQLYYEKYPEHQYTKQAKILMEKYIK